MPHKTQEFPQRTASRQNKIDIEINSTPAILKHDLFKSERDRAKTTSFEIAEFAIIIRICGSFVQRRYVIG
jgi:hypothetical protein